MNPQKWFWFSLCLLLGLGFSYLSFKTSFQLPRESLPSPVLQTSPSHSALPTLPKQVEEMPLEPFVPMSGTGITSSSQNPSPQKNENPPSVVDSESSVPPDVSVETKVESKGHSSTSPPSSGRVIFRSDFEKKDWFDDFRSQKLATKPKGLERCKRVYDGKKQSYVLRVQYPFNELGLQNSGAYWRMFLPETFDKITLSYDVKFRKSFDWVLGGKLPGLAGGEKEDDPGKEVSGGHKPTGTNGWSVRVMWRENGAAENYIYHADQPGVYGHRLKWKKKDEDVFFKPGKWHHIVMEVTLNDPKRANGRIQTWLDGRKVLEYKKLRFRKIPSLKIDSLFFSTFFGGEEPDWAARRDENIWFDNIEVAETTSVPN